ncbi:Gti1/Pac2 family-domain-containing protein [Phlebopus sp. FC_14]|nr:Gti1/Pac2 family-domain-containing protein [Phlebopus sp. FC_14]
MQQPTCTRLRVKTPQDAQVVFHAVNLGILPMVTRRLDSEERRTIASGSIFVWEERGANPETAGLGIERWTDGKRWGPSRVRDEFLFYQEKEPVDGDPNSDSDTTMASTSRPQHDVRHRSARSSLVKQTYSVFVDTPRGRRKWHLIAYFTSDTVDHLRTISSIPELARLDVPPGKYRSARHNTTRQGRACRDEQAYYSLPLQSPSYSSPPRLSHASFRSAIEDLRRMDCQRDNQDLAPLVYLQNLAPPRRHPVDEEALMALSRLT